MKENNRVIWERRSGWRLLSRLGGLIWTSSYIQQYGQVKIRKRMFQVVATGKENGVGDFVQVKWNRICISFPGGYLLWLWLQGSKTTESTCFLLWVCVMGPALWRQTSPSFHVRWHNKLAHIVPSCRPSWYHLTIISTGWDKARAPLSTCLRYYRCSV